MKVKVVALPDHILYYYKLEAGETHVKDFKTDAQTLCMRLAGVWQQALADPNSFFAKTERNIQVNSPSVQRAGFAGIACTVTALTEGEVVCLVPKTELAKAVHPTALARYLNSPNFTVIIDF